MKPATSFFALVALTLSAQAFDWPQWRGAKRDDLSPETGLLKEWPAEGPKRLWLYEKAGNGYSGPAIVNGRFSRWAHVTSRRSCFVLMPPPARSAGPRPSAMSSITSGASGRAARRPWTETLSMR